MSPEFIFGASFVFIFFTLLTVASLYSIKLKNEAKQRHH